MSLEQVLSSAFARSSGQDYAGVLLEDRPSGGCRCVPLSRSELKRFLSQQNRADVRREEDGSEIIIGTNGKRIRVSEEGKSAIPDYLTADLNSAKICGNQGRIPLMSLSYAVS